MAFTLQVPERAWLLQANPDRYDIDSALKSIDTIHWRLPQYSSDVNAGDIALIWRSGTDAGIVAVGRISSEPSALAVPEIEQRFTVDPREGFEVTTRGAVRLRAIPLLPKAAVAALPEMRDHAIIKAPMQTVYPLTPEQWHALEGLLPGQAPQSTPVEYEELPKAFSWNQRRKSAYPLPGGYDAYVTNLKSMLDWVAEHKPKREALERWLRDKFSYKSGKAASEIVDFLHRASLFQTNGGSIELSPYGAKWLQTRDAAYLVALLHSRIQFIGEMIASIIEPRSPEEILAIANIDYSMGWQTRAQVDRRRGWLQSAGVISADSEGRLVATEAGRQLLPRLELQSSAPSAPPSQGEAPATVAVQPRAMPFPVLEPQVNPITSPDELEVLLRRTASLATAPIEFEHAVAAAFASLGFDATNLGGSGKTDILLVAALGPTDSYRVIVDCKTTSHEGVSDPQIDWTTLDEHREKHEANYVAVVGPAFSGPRVQERARQKHVTLLDVKRLITIRQQHLRVPMGLETYRLLFDNADADHGAASVAEAADDFSRWLNLGADILRLARALELTEGPLSARDLYWNLRQSGEQFSSVADSDIQVVLEALSRSPLALLRKTSDNKFQTLGSLATTRARLEALAMLLGDVGTLKK